jgi:hypothetical protein
MPVSFVNPSLLLGMLAAVVPILVHLLSRRRIRRLQFSDLRFLEDVQSQQARSLDLRRLLLLLLRVLAILCVVLAVARPRLAGLAAGPDGARSVLFILDSSASMQTQQGSGTRFTSSLEACLDLAAGLPEGSEIQILKAGAVTSPLFASWMPTSGPLGERLEVTDPQDGACDLAAALQAAARWVAIALTQPVQIVLLSDLQRLPFDEVSLREAVRQLQATGQVQLMLRQIGQPQPNGGVREVRLPLRALREGEGLRLVAEVLLERPEQVCWLELDGRRVAEAAATGQAGSASSVEFAVTAPGPGLHRGLVLKESDRLPVDDARPFVLQVWNHVPLLLVHGKDRGTVGRGTAGRGGWRYLEEALTPGGQEEALFRVRPVTSDQLAAGDLDQAVVAVFIDPDPLGRQLLGSLMDWLSGGGTAVFLLGDRTQEAYMSETLLPALGLPGQAEWRSRSADGREEVSVLATDHPVFAGLGEAALATLADVPWQRYFAVAEGNSRVLISFTSEAPALLEASYGQGTFLLLPFDLNLDASALPLSPMFLPLVQRLMTYLAGRTGGGGGNLVTVGQRPEVRIAGSPADIDPLADAAALLVSGPMAGRASTADLVWRQGIPYLVAPPAQRSGFYTFTAAAETVGVVAAAVPAVESEPRLWEVAEVQDILVAAGLARPADVTELAASQLGVAMRGREIAAWFLALAVLLLCLELYLARGLGQAEAPA